MTVQAGISNAPAILQAYAQRHGIELSAFRSDGRLLLEIDDHHRVYLRPSANGAIAITARLLGLDDLADAAQDDLLVRLSGLAAGLIRDHAAALALEEGGRGVMLQLTLSGALGVDELEDELADFVNGLNFWTRAAVKESSRRSL